ncbi:MAG TPA: rhodanese-like domain-containing protein [Ilumatobacteraceae bacterium]|jgi:rhodanese-related sulfurtransferase
MSVSEVSVDELEAALRAGAKLVDVREPDEYTAGHVPGAVLVPLSSVPSALDQFSADATTYVICKTGARSYRACEFLVDQGLDAANVEGGTMAWVISGRGTVAGDQPA